MRNASWLCDLLPSNSPLSTMRVITTSTWSVDDHTSYPIHDSVPTTTTSATSTSSSAANGGGSIGCVSSGSKGGNEGKEDMITSDIDGRGDFSHAETKDVTDIDTTDNNNNTITPTTNTTATNNSNSNTSKEDDTIDTSYKRYIKALSAVLRLGRANAATDHSSILFNVDLNTGIYTFTYYSVICLIYSSYMCMLMYASLPICIMQ